MPQNKLPATDSGIFLWMTYHAMKQTGLDCAAIFASVGMPDSPPDPNMRQINSPQGQFWAAAEKVSGDPDIGLHIGGAMPAFRGQVIEYLFLSSPTFGEGLERTLRYHRLLTDALHIKLRIEGGSAILYGFEHPVRHYLECAVAALMQFLWHVTDAQFQAQEIGFIYTEGAAPEDYERIYRCPVRLGATEGIIRFDAALLERPSPAAEPQLLAVHENLALQRISDLDRRELVHKIEYELTGLLERGEVTLESVATLLNKNPRTLRADLAHIGTHFNDVVANYRKRLAQQLLAQTQAPLDQIVYRTGFSEPSAFIRAFKRWTGETPMSYRARKQPERKH